MFHSFLYISGKIQELFCSLSFIFTLWSTEIAKSTKWQVFFMLALDLASCQDWVIHLYLKVLENFNSSRFLGQIPVCAYIIC